MKDDKFRVYARNILIKNDLPIPVPIFIPSLVRLCEDKDCEKEIKTMKVDSRNDL